MNPKMYPHYGAPCGWQMPSWCPNHPPVEPAPAPMPMPAPIWDDEYRGVMPAKIRQGYAPECPMTAVIPLLSVSTPDNLKGLCNCFVHVDQNNTTYYIDDQHRMTITWAGPVIADDYDYENNPLGLRSQEVWDFKNGRVIKYNAVGEHMLFNKETE